MKKLLLSMTAMMFASAAFAQPFIDESTSFTQSFGSAGTSCLKNFGNAGYQYPDGNIQSASNDADEITVTAKGELTGGLAPGLFDFYYTNNSDQCSDMRSANVGVDLTGGTPFLIVRAKASVDGATVQFHVASAPNAYPTATSASAGVPVAQTQKVLTTSYADYVIDFTGAEWNAISEAVRQKINMWGVLIPDDNEANSGVVVKIDRIYVGNSDITSSKNANVVNDKVALFPNPAKSYFDLDMTAMNNTSAASVKVMNANGLMVKEFTTSSAVERIATEGMNKGIYLVQITSGNKIATKKVVVE